MNGFALKGNICYSVSSEKFREISNGYVLCADGVCMGAFEKLPPEYKTLPVMDYGDRLIIPGLIDLHVHAPQYPFMGMGMNMELPDWLNTYAFPEEKRYSDMGYAKRAYKAFVGSLLSSATTRAAIFATIHAPATLLLMELLEATGLVTFVGKVSMDRNAPESLCEQAPDKVLEHWLEKVFMRKFANTKPILTPRFIPACTDELMNTVAEFQKKYKLPLQSHLSENESECELVKQLCPDSQYYGDAYDRRHLFGVNENGEKFNTLMAHCVLSDKKEMKKMAENGVTAVHCPASNTNLSSGIAPVGKLMQQGVKVGLGTDAAAGDSLSMFRAITDAVRVSKLYSRLCDRHSTPLSFMEAFSMATLTGGGFFGKVGSFEPMYEFDAVVLDDSAAPAPKGVTIAERLERFAYLSLDRTGIAAKFVKGKKIYSKIK